MITDAMKIVSINIGLPREIFHQGRMMQRGIFRAPIEGQDVLLWPIAVQTEQKRP
jgi:hypothetical protein